MNETKIRFYDDRKQKHQSFECDLSCGYYHDDLCINYNLSCYGENFEQARQGMLKHIDKMIELLQSQKQVLIKHKDKFDQGLQTDNPFVRIFTL